MTEAEREQQAREKVAQIWCEPRHSHKEMDCDMADSILKLLAAQRATVLEEVANMVEDCKVPGDRFALRENLIAHLRQQAREQRP